MKKVVKLTESDLTRIVKRTINEVFGKKNPKKSVHRLDDFDNPKNVRIEEAPNVVAIPIHVEESAPSIGGKRLLYVLKDTLNKLPNPYLFHSTIDGYVMANTPFNDKPVNNLKDAMIQVQEELDDYIKGEPERKKAWDEYAKERFGNLKM